MPDIVTTPLVVSTSIFDAPTCGSLSSAVLTRAVMVASSMVSPIGLPARCEGQRQDDHGDEGP